jgi:hypothetical protein
MIRWGGSSGFTEPERNPSSLTMLGVRQAVRRAINGDAGRAGFATGGEPQEVDKGKGRPKAARPYSWSILAR